MQTAMGGHRQGCTWRKEMFEQASTNSGWKRRCDPFPTWGKRAGELPPRLFFPLSLSEDQVAQETEEVFRSYAFYRYQQEREESGEEVPLDPEIAEIQQELGR